MYLIQVLHDLASIQSALTFHADLHSNYICVGYYDVGATMYTYLSGYSVDIMLNGHYRSMITRH